MKKILTVLIAAMAMLITTSCYADTYSSNPNVLPAKAQQTLKKYFSGKVNHIKIDKNFLGKSDYDVILSDGSEIEFNCDGDVKEVESNTGVPAGLMPKSIVTYVSRNYKGAKIVKLDVGHSKYEIELSNGIDLEFDRSGRFLRVD